MVDDDLELDSVVDQKLDTVAGDALNWPAHVAVVFGLESDAVVGSNRNFWE